MKKQEDIGDFFMIGRLTEGSREALRYFFDKYYVELCNFVFLYVSDRDLAEEIVQDLFVYLWENRTRLQIDSSVKGYFYGASRFRSLNHLRDSKNRERIHQEIIEREFSVDSPDMPDSLDYNEFQQLLDEAIRELAPKCREIFLMSKQQSMSNRQIAEQLGVSVKTVENQMTIALKKLREHLLPHRERIFFLLLSGIGLCRF